MKQLFLVILQKTTSLSSKMKFKVTIGARNILPSIQLLFISQMIMVTFHANHFVSFLMIINMTHVLFIGSRNYLLIRWKSIIPILQCCSAFLIDVLDNIKIVKIWSTYAIIVTILDWMQSRYFCDKPWKITM